MNYILCSKDMSEIPEEQCCNKCDECPIEHVDWTELMIQISDVMRKANRIRPIISHREAVLMIKDIVKEVE